MQDDTAILINCIRAAGVNCYYSAALKQSLWTWDFSSRDPRSILKSFSYSKLAGWLPRIRIISNVIKTGSQSFSVSVPVVTQYNTIGCYSDNRWLMLEKRLKSMIFLAGKANHWLLPVRRTFKIILRSENCPAARHSWMFYEVQEKFCCCIQPRIKRCVHPAENPYTLDCRSEFSIS